MALSGQMETANHVLVIDDDSAARGVLVKMLEGLGYGFTAAGDGQEGLTRLREGQRPGVILLDFVMPRMNGAEFLRQLREEPDPAIARIPVLVMTAMPSALALMQGLAPDGYLLKPFRLDELRQALEPFFPKGSASERRVSGETWPPPPPPCKGSLPSAT
jgi:CheY-like chemotaxis protein